MQQVKVQIKSTWITITGLIAGIVISCFNIKSLWWLCLILLGGLGNTIVQMLSLYQRKFALKKFESLEELSLEELNLEGLR